jgi:hypothetical protein
MQKFLGPKKDSLVPIPHVQPIGWSGTEKFWPLAKRTDQRKQGFEFEVSQAKSVARTKKLRVVLPL